MSAILSADDLNDFISPGVACIKPVETLPLQIPATDPANPYEVTTEDQIQPAAAPDAQISLTDCLACSGCVTSAEAVLVSLQSHAEVLSTLDAYPALSLEDAKAGAEGKIFVASVSPQTRANLAVTYGVSEAEAGAMLEQLLAGEQGLASGGVHRSKFTWVVDTNTLRDICHAAGIEEVQDTIARRTTSSDTNGASNRPKLPILTSSCPGWICYAEKTHPHVLPHISRLKSPQALAGTMIKSILSRRFGISPDKIWHVAVMPCFDKKLEASREELTDSYWRSEQTEKRGVRDVDCVITAREVLMLAESRGLSFPSMSRVSVTFPAFPDETVNSFLFDRHQQCDRSQKVKAGSSGSYAYEILQAYQSQYPGSHISVERGRNVDVVDYMLKYEDEILMRTGRYYGFRNIQNLVRKLKPPKRSRMPGSRQVHGASTSGLAEYTYLEVMACPGGCTNGGGQVKVTDMPELLNTESTGKKAGPAEQKEWLARTDEAYFSADSSDDESVDCMDIDNRQTKASKYMEAKEMMRYWASSTGINLASLVFTTFRQVESDVGKDKKATSDMERVAGLASTLGGGW